MTLKQLQKTIQDIIDIAYFDATQDAACGEAEQAEKKRKLIFL